MTCESHLNKAVVLKNEQKLELSTSSSMLFPHLCLLHIREKKRHPMRLKSKLLGETFKCPTYLLKY